MSASAPTPTNRDALSPILQHELARQHLLDFAAYVDPGYESARHLRLIAEHLEALERREIRRLAICMPPRHGKTELASRKFIAWYLGRNPTHDVILASYASELAEGNSRAVRSIVEGNTFPFPGVSTRDDSRSAGRWQLNKGGVIRAVGVGTGLTGFGGELIVADDLVKDRAEADSEVIRESTAAWFNDVLRTRANPGLAFAIIGTLWHEDDVLSRVLNGPSGNEWTKLILPLIAEDENDLLGRQPGEWLWPGRFGPDDLPSVEKGEISPRSWSALYQQHPTPADGGTFRREYFTHRYSELPKFETTVEMGPWGVPETSTRGVRYTKITAIDGAWKVGVGRDFTAIVTLATEGRNFYILDVVRAQLEFPDLLARVTDLNKVHKPSRIVVEEAASGFAIVQTLKTRTNLPVLGVPPKGSKESRADSVTGLFHTGRVLLPERAPWVETFVDEFLSFPNGKHDDQVDATVLGISSLMEIYERNVASAHRRYHDWERSSVAWRRI